MTEGIDEFALEPVKRVAVFEALLGGTPTRTELGEQLDVSRATLHRIVSFLTEADLAVETDDGLALTSHGRLVGEEVTGYVDRVTTARELEPLVSAVDLSALPAEFDLALFRNAQVVLPKPGQPQRPAQRIVELVEGADRVRGLGPVVLPVFVELFHREILDGMTVEMVIEPDVVEGLEEAYAEQFDAATATGNLDVGLHDALPFGLVLTADAVGLIGYDEDDVLRAVVESEDDDLRAWATTLFETYRESATSLED
jgi:predicted transcriptional regulator